MSFGKTVNLGNSIIGVSILAMPYCFVKSGLLLSVLLIVFSGFLTRLSCHFLLKSAFISKRRSFELMVHDVLGSTGRFLVEIGLIGFLLGTCVAYFIMIGDLAPKIIAELLDLKYNRNIRIFTVIFLSIFVALPLSLLKKVDSLTSFSLLSMILYCCLILKLMFETTDKISMDKLGPDKFDDITYWDLSGLLTTFPIFSMAMSCQTSLFEIFDNSVSTSDLDTIKRDNKIIKNAIFVCSFVYITVGLLGYMAFHEQTLYGNIILAFNPSLTTLLTKVGFIITLLLSFPLCLFPCRTSVHSLTIGKLRKITNFQQLPTSPSAATLVGMADIENSCGYSTASKDDYCDNDKNNNSKHANEEEELYSLSRLATHQISATSRISPNSINITANGTKNNLYPYTSLLQDDSDTTGQPNFHSKEFNSNSINLGHGSPKLYISDSQFRILTVILICITVILSLMFPHIEFILGIIGSTAGTTVCFILPAYTFIKIGGHTRTELLLARLLLFIGMAILVFCTYSTIRNASLKVPIE